MHVMIYLPSLFSFVTAQKQTRTQMHDYRNTDKKFKLFTFSCCKANRVGKGKPAIVVSVQEKVRNRKVSTQTKGGGKKEGGNRH